MVMFLMIASAFLGAIIGVTIMCLMQVSKDDYPQKEQNDE